MLTLFLLLIIAATVCAFLALIDVAARINLTALGLLFVCAALLTRTVG